MKTTQKIEKLEEEKKCYIHNSSKKIKKLINKVSKMPYSKSFNGQYEIHSLMDEIEEKLYIFNSQIEKLKKYEKEK